MPMYETQRIDEYFVGVGGSCLCSLMALRLGSCIIAHQGNLIVDFNH